MEDIFRKLCKISAGIDSDQNKITVKEKEKEKQKEERLKEKEEERKDRAREDEMKGIRKASFYSQRMNRIVGAKSAISSMSQGFKKRGDRRKSESDVSKPAEKVLTEEEIEKKKVMETIIKELKDPNRDCNNFDPGNIKS